MPFTPDVYTRTSALSLDVSQPPEVFEAHDVSTGMKFNICHASTMERYKAERDALQQLLNARDEKIDRMTSALKFYADKEHFYHGDDNWDSVSGEPSNILWHAEEPYSVEDGWFARKALENQA